MKRSNLRIFRFVNAALSLLDRRLTSAIDANTSSHPSGHKAPLAGGRAAPSVVGMFATGWLTRTSARFQLIAVTLAALFAVGPQATLAQPTSNLPPRHLVGHSADVSPLPELTYSITLGTEVAHGVYNVNVVKTSRTLQTMTRYHVGHFYEDEQHVEHRIKSRPTWLTENSLNVGGVLWKPVGADIVTRRGVFAANETLQLDPVKVTWRLFETSYAEAGTQVGTDTTKVVTRIKDHPASNLEAILQAVDAAPVISLTSLPSDRPSQIVAVDPTTLTVVGIAIAVAAIVIPIVFTWWHRKNDTQQKRDACHATSDAIKQECDMAAVRRDSSCLQAEWDCCKANFTMNSTACDANADYDPVAPANWCEIVCH